MKILVLSFYYQPDLCAGSFRCSALIDQLKTHANVQIEVITTQPNRYSTFTSEALAYENEGNVTINRISLPSHKSGMLDQVKAFHTYFRRARKLTKNKEYDLVFATSSRLFTAFLGARISRIKKIPLYLDIRDIFVDTIGDVLSPKFVWLVKPIFSLIERYSFSSANKINLVSKGFKEYFDSRYESKNYSWYTNGIDEEFLDIEQNKDKGVNDSRVKRVLYAGNIGEGQGLHNILPDLAKRMEHKIKFRIIGDGGRKSALQEQVENISNIELLPPVSRQELIKEYMAADILFLHLNDYAAFKKVLPSKVFEYAALGKPVWAGVTGYAAEFIQDEVENSAVFYPGNTIQAEKEFNLLSLKHKKRLDFIVKYSRKNIMAKMADDIISVGVK